MSFEIKNGAIFISDAHINENRNELYGLLNLINEGEIKTSQLFLMGDIFDFVTGYTEYSFKFYQDYINLIESIAAKIEVFYIEGNHDFRLKRLFKNVKVYEISEQPVKFKANKRCVNIAHGDNFLPFVSKYALLFLRIKWFLIFMNFIDRLLNFRISKRILNYLKFKKLDYKIPNFKAFITPKMSHYNADIVIEGHYHQGCVFDIDKILYVNLPAFACDQRYFIVEYSNDNIKFVEKN